MKKKISIVILTYNNCNETTIPCIDSVLKETPHENLEIIIVDNLSTDETREVIKEYEKQNSKIIKAILNDENYGYAKGNNIGIEIASGDYVILLNNDTVVTPNWIDTLLALFDKDETIGLIGPVSNSVGNEQMLACPDLTIDNFHAFAEEYVNKRKGNYFFTENLGFFCVAISRKVIDTIGVLDPNYGIGMFEDTDYCLQATKAGFKLAVSEDTFIFHSGSFSFKKLSSEQYQEIFTENRKYFLSKNEAEWGISQVSVAFWDKLLQDVNRLKLYYENNNESLPPALEDIMMRTDSQSALLSILKVIEDESKELNYGKILCPE